MAPTSHWDQSKSSEYFFTKTVLPMRILNTILYTIFCCFFSVQCFAANFYRIQIGEFANKIPFTHFAFSGVSDIFMATDVNNIHHYYLRATFEKYLVANRVKDSLILRGFSNATVISLEKEEILPLEVVGYSPTLLYKNNTALLKIIHYGFDKHKLTHTSKKKLNKLAKQFKTCLNLKLLIIGHTDAKGNAVYNVELSKNRIRAVKKYLIRKGISPDQIMAKACGEANPLLSNINEEGIDLPENRKHNRRVLILTINEQGEIINECSTGQTVRPILERELLKN